MRNRRFLICQLTPPDLAFGQIGKASSIYAICFSAHQNSSTQISFIGGTHLSNSEGSQFSPLIRHFLLFPPAQYIVTTQPFLQRINQYTCHYSICLVDKVIKKIIHFRGGIWGWFILLFF